MFGFLLAILKSIVLKLATTGAFNFMMPTLLKIDKWCEDKIDPVSRPDQKFCSNRCKKQFEKALRLWSLDQFKGNHVSLIVLKRQLTSN